MTSASWNSPSTVRMPFGSIRSMPVRTRSTFGFFKRLREEDPVHFNTTELAGRYWSLTKYEDIKAVDSDHENFSSAHGITLGLPVGTELPEGALNVSMFIAMDLSLIHI